MTEMAVRATGTTVPELFLGIILLTLTLPQNERNLVTVRAASLTYRGWWPP